MGLILWPAAEGGDLRHYLHSSIDRDHELLRRLFGCLSIGLNFLSSTCNLRHNDIKTSNILIHESHVLFTDFGSAKKFEDRFGITEGAKTGTSTRLYAAPEILNMGPRNIKTDLFALGCIFAEVLTVMGGRTVKNLHDHMRKGSKGSEVQYGENVPRLREWLHGCYGGKEDLRIPLAWCLKMIVKDVDERPHLVNLIQDMRKNCMAENQLEDFFCEQCLEELEPPVASSNHPVSSSDMLVGAVQRGVQEEAEELAELEGYDAISGILRQWTRLQECQE